jgi:hypothetical protein
MITGSEDTMVKIWDMKEMELLFEFEDAHEGKIKQNMFII